jgi:hypothetical protein
LRSKSEKEGLPRGGTPALGAGGPEFKSRRPDQSPQRFAASIAENQGFSLPGHVVPECGWMCPTAGSVTTKATTSASRGGGMKALRRNDRHDADRAELKLVRVGHALWAIMKRDRARNGGYLPQSDPIWEALETVWKLKKEYRTELAARRQIESAELRAKFAWVQVGT